jgi:hypothetical protein
MGKRNLEGIIEEPKVICSVQLWHPTMLTEQPDKSINGTYIFSPQLLVLTAAMQEKVDENWTRIYPALQQKRQLLTAI